MAMNRRLIYLASPYSNVEGSPMTLQDRYNLTEEAVVNFLNKNIVMFSPIIHNHHLAMIHALRTDAGYWEEFNTTFITRCDEVWVLCLDDWEKSLGMQAEIRLALQLDKPVRYIEYIAKPTWNICPLPPVKD